MSRQTEITEQFFVVTALLEKTGEEIFNRVGLTVKTYAILAHIRKGANTTSELAKCMQGSLASITQKTKVLEKNGFIKRVVKKEDKRFWYFSLTPKAGKVLKKVIPLFDKAVKNLYKSFTKKEQEQLLRILTIIEKRLHIAIDTKHLAKIFNS